MTGYRRGGRIGPLGLCAVVCAFSATGCGSLWPFASRAPADPVQTKVQAAPPAEPENPAVVEDDKPSRWIFFTPWKWERFHPHAPPGEAETLVLRGDQLEPEKPPIATKKTSSKVTSEMSGAYELYRLGDYEKAGKIFRRVADDGAHTPPPLVEEARFYEAECLRRQLLYPRACDTYHKLLMDSPNGPYREQTLQRIFDIANYWLEDTRQEIAASEKERKNGKKESKEDQPKDKDGKKPSKNWKSKFVVGHWEKTKPFVDEEGRALEALEWVRYGDNCIGPLAEECLWMAGSIKFYREDYREADHLFTQLAEMHPNSKHVEAAVELSIVCKHMSTGGPDYDGRKVAEARQMIFRALASYPTLAHQKKDFLIRQLGACTMQQAETDYNMADFYRRTGHPGSAYFYYEIVRRRYPGTPFYLKATNQMLALRRELEKKQQPEPPLPGDERMGRETTPPPREVKPGGPVEETAPPPKPLPPNMGQ